MYREKRKYRVPIRTMIAADLGLDLLISPYDPELLKAGLKVPKLSKKARLQNQMSAMRAVPRNRSNNKSNYKPGHTIENVIVRQKVERIFSLWRNFGQVRNK